ncbi:MAG: thiamine-phosphate kinase [Bacteroidales bacterium]|nr:thiamine-phosphate kinase [Bacteroidales bacterium]MBQ2006296.1 thiamine-phosphate kinase [Bacteroidales bacterium]MBQ5582548.1 thiamine-phosphate kinase [Bacteroidales bacterium]
MSSNPLGEFQLIQKISSQFSPAPGTTGIGDDCAVIPQKTGLDSLISTDMLIDGTHFLIEHVDPYQLGWKSAAVNISDIAAMGGKAVASFLSFALPKSLPEGWVERFINGYKDISDLFTCPLLGGDTTRSIDRLCISVTVLGQAASGKAKLRSSAQVGDLICTSGCIGDSAAGLDCILNKAESTPLTETLIKRHYLPMPRIQEGLALAQIDGVHAMMDISDGIGSDLRHILKASRKGAVIDCCKLPISDEVKQYCEQTGKNPLEFALSGGEDYELLFTISPEAEKSLEIKHFVIGEINSEEGIQWLGADKDYLGFRHF